eukprot:TRINITY_DN7479_c0_g2_i1.p1 TRINITY_DN7479_c0_g2~~TRINITY_DN7479_c0_g2_i1.p1  ORF type:complete len:139 (+),score=26.79 TRINITY_DN7479_c0_g2_i1:65-481(+)
MCIRDSNRQGTAQAFSSGRSGFRPSQVLPYFANVDPFKEYSPIIRSLSDKKIPILIYHGTSDLLISARSTETLLDGAGFTKSDRSDVKSGETLLGYQLQYNNVRLIGLSGVGRCLGLEYPTAVVQILSTFIEESRQSA